jgi:hypothetical protein
MFSKNITFKNKQLFINNVDKDNEFILNIELKSNHDVDKNALQYIESHLNNLAVYNYTKKKD